MMLHLEKQVCSLEPAKRLKELGVKQESLFYWDEVWSVKLGTHHDTHHDVFSREIIKEDNLPATAISAFTVSELGEMLPKVENLVTMFFENGRCQICLQGNVENNDGIATRWGAAGQSIEADTEADARAKMLIYLLENKLISL